MQENNMLETDAPVKPGKGAVCGLTSEQAAERAARYGKNELAAQKKARPLRIFLGQFRDIMVIILIIAAAVSVFLGEITDALTVLIIVLLDALLGFFQEYRTEKTLFALRKMTASSARVWRDGHLCTIPSEDVVPDDIISVSAGDKVPADAFLISARSLLADESILTGESAAVGKSAGGNFDSDDRIGRDDYIYGGTLIVRGSGEARVAAIGKDTQVGRISGMLSDITDEETPLQKRLAELGRVIAVICIVICAAVSAAGIIRGEPVFDMLMTGITIAIAAIPEGLPAAVTIALALAVRRMLKRKALVRRLRSVETLGCTSVICTDKTGTITENKMTVTEIFADGRNYIVSGTGSRMSGEWSCDGIKQSAGRNAVLDLMAEDMVLCSNADIYPDTDPQRAGEWVMSGDPTESALLAAAAKYGADIALTRQKNPRRDEIPFESETRRMTVVCEHNGTLTGYTKGAYDSVSGMCRYIMHDGKKLPFTESDKKVLSAECDRMSADGLRVLAFAVRQDGEKDMVFLGMCGMTDPPRPEARKAVSLCRQAHIRTVMITGDHKNTAAAAARSAGIYHSGDIIVDGEELAAMSDEELSAKLGSISVYARVTPSDKLRIVRMFKKSGSIVTMTGDGVNDAPAVREADIGVAMGLTGTDVTRLAADMVLLDDNFATLVSAVEQGRGIYANIRKFVRYLLSCNIGEVLTMFLGIVMGMPMVLLPPQILLVNLVTDGLPAVALGAEPVDPDCMKAPPRRPDESFFSGGLASMIIFRGIMIGLCTLGCFSVIIGAGYGLTAARTAALVTLVMSQLIHVFECKSEKKSIFTIPVFGNPKLVGAVLISLAVLVLAVYFPPLQGIFSTVALGERELAVSLGFAAAAPLIRAFALMFTEK